MNKTEESQVSSNNDECQESRTQTDMNQTEETQASARMDECQASQTHLDVGQPAEPGASASVDECKESQTYSDANQGYESQMVPSRSPDDDDQSNGPSLNEVLFGVGVAGAVLLAGWGLSNFLKKNEPEPAESDDDEEASGLGGLFPDQRRPPRESLPVWDMPTGRRRGTSRRLKIKNIGINFNQWRQPVATFGPAEGNMQREICWKLDLDNFDINSTDWKKATDVADRVISMLLQEVSKKASDYKLVIQKGVRQGSAREGLKVCVADEFDVLLPFTIEGLKFEVQPDVDKDGRILPEIGKLRVVYPTSDFKDHYPKLWSKKAFDDQQGHVYLNSKYLHEKVFTAIIDKAREAVQVKLDSNADCEFQITRAINQPAVKITIKVKKNRKDFNIGSLMKSVFEDIVWEGTLHAQGAGPKELDLMIDVDLVPALLICYDKVPDPTNRRVTMPCPRYAVFKWVREQHPFPLTYGVNPETIWRMDSSGYEKHVMDVAQGTPEQRYILTAQRVLKAYFIYENKKRERNNLSPSQLVTVLRSYFLKQIAFYCILYYTVLNKYPLSGVKEALTILLDFLHICLEEKRLPHFFHSNPGLRKMFPEYDIERNAIRYDVFHNISQEALRQADYGLRRDVRPTLDDFTCDLNVGAKRIQHEFREYVVRGTYL